MKVTETEAEHGKGMKDRVYKMERQCRWDVGEQTEAQRMSAGMEVGDQVRVHVHV